MSTWKSRLLERQTLLAYVLVRNVTTNRSIFETWGRIGDKPISSISLHCYAGSIYQYRHLLRPSICTTTIEIAVSPRKWARNALDPQYRLGYVHFPEITRMRPTLLAYSPKCSCLLFFGSLKSQANHVYFAFRIITCTSGLSCVLPLFRVPAERTPYQTK